MSQEPFSLKTYLQALGFFALLVYGVVVLSGNLTKGPRLEDDNQIFKLQIEFAEKGFVETWKGEISSRLDMKRLFPIFCTQKVILAKVLGTNMVAWSFYTATIGVLTAFFLFYFCSLLNFNVFESFLFSLFVLLGEQSVLWWRLIHGEGIGLLLFSLGLIFLVKNVNTAKRHQLLLSSFFIAGATLSKESFILMLPAVGFLYLWLKQEKEGLTFTQTFRRNLLFPIFLFINFSSLLIVITVYFGTTEFDYAGYAGFDLGKFWTVLAQYLWVTNFGLVPILALILWYTYKLPSKERSQTKPALLKQQLILLFLLWGLITLPQLILYMKSGIRNINQVAHYTRYIIPMSIGMAYTSVYLIREIRLMAKRKKMTFSHYILLPFIFLPLLDGLIDAGQEAYHFERYSKENDKFFDSIVKNTSKDDNILIYFRGIEAYSIQAVQRVRYILNVRHDRKNIYHLPFPDAESIPRLINEVELENTRQHARKMKTLADVENKADIDAIIFFNYGEILGDNRSNTTVLTAELRKGNESWFNPDDFIRKDFRHRHINFYRKKNM